MSAVPKIPGKTIIDPPKLDEAAIARIKAAENPPGPRVVTMSTVKRQFVEWIWYGRIVRGMLNLIDGDPGVGKSTITIDIAARLTRGEVMPLEMPALRDPADVLLIGQEDHLAATVQPRLVAAGADLSRVHVLEAVPRPDDPDAPPTLQDASVVEKVAVSHRIALVIVDPVMAHLPSGTDAYRDSEMRQLLSPWAAMAQRTNIGVLLVRHLRKMGGSALYRGGGTIGIVGAARSALLVGRDPQDATTCVLAHAKGNLAPPPPSLSYRVVDADGVGRIEWIGKREISADQLAALPDVRGKTDENPVDAAASALTEVLRDGPRATKQVEADVKAMTGCSPRTIERARAKLGVRAEPVLDEQTGKVAGWQLRLPGGGVDLESRPPTNERGGGVDYWKDKAADLFGTDQSATSTGGVDDGGVE